jgi:hypothetical protein
MDHSVPNCSIQSPRRGELYAGNLGSRLPAQVRDGERRLSRFKQPGHLPPFAPWRPLRKAGRFETGRSVSSAMRGGGAEQPGSAVAIEPGVYDAWRIPGQSSTEVSDSLKCLRIEGERGPFYRCRTRCRIERHRRSRGTGRGRLRQRWPARCSHVEPGYV